MNTLKNLKKKRDYANIGGHKKDFLQVSEVA
jgi:hypothetical protein